jgi:hypothetical protein
VSAVAVLILVAGIVGFVTMREPGAADTHPPAPDGRLVVEEEPGFFGRLLGHEPRLFITVPGGTPLPLETQTPIHSATTRPGEALVAKIVEPITIEGHEAIPSGARVHGRVTQVESAEEAEGRGRLNLEFSAVALPDGSRVRFESERVELVAPPPRPARRQRGGLAGAWDKLTSTVGDIVREIEGGEDSGKLSGAQAVEGRTGVDVEVPVGSTLEIELTHDVTVVRSRDP